LKDPEVEGVLLTTPHTLHADQVVAAAEAGKHVFVEKPFTLTVADGRRATDACRRAGVVLAVGHGRRRQPANRALKGMVEAGTLGRVVQIEGNVSSNSGFNMKPGGWRTDPRETPAGAMTGLGIHHVDTFQYLMGPITRLAAFSSRQILQGIEIHDTSGILFEFASEPWATSGPASWSRTEPTSSPPTEPRPRPSRRRRAPGSSCRRRGSGAVSGAAPACGLDRRRVGRVCPLRPRRHAARGGGRGGYRQRRRPAGHRRIGQGRTACSCRSLRLQRRSRLPIGMTPRPGSVHE